MAGASWRHLWRLQGLREFFTAPSHPVNLAILRIVVFQQMYRVISQTRLDDFVQAPAQLRMPPIGYGWCFDWIPISQQLLDGIRPITQIACLLAMAGLFSRLGALVATLGGLYLLGLPACFGKISHVYHHLIWFGSLLAASRCGDAISIDWLLRQYQNRGPGRWRMAAPSALYGTPLRIAWVLLGVAYFFPGWHKLLAGPQWIFSDNLKHILYTSWYAMDPLPGFRIDQHPWLCRLGAASVIFFEMGFVFALFVPAMRWLFVAAGLAFHQSNAYFLGIQFSALIVCYVMFFDVHALIGTIIRWIGRITPLPRLHAAIHSWWLDRSAAPVESSLRGVVALGAIWFCGNLLTGAMAVDSWPVSCYPRFSGIRSQPENDQYQWSVVSLDGNPRIIQPKLAQVVLIRIYHNVDSARHRQGLDQLARWLLQNDPGIQPGDKLQLHRIVTSTVPQENKKELRRELIAEYRRN